MSKATGRARPKPTLRLSPRIAHVTFHPRPSTFSMFSAHAQLKTRNVEGLGPRLHTRTNPTTVTLTAHACRGLNVAQMLEFQLVLCVYCDVILYCTGGVLFYRGEQGQSNFLPKKNYLKKALLLCGATHLFTLYWQTEVASLSKIGMCSEMAYNYNESCAILFLAQSVDS